MLWTVCGGDFYAPSGRIHQAAPTTSNNNDEDAIDTGEIECEWTIHTSPGNPITMKFTYAHANWC
jgi:hypothetical protein